MSLSTKHFKEEQAIAPALSFLFVCLTVSFSSFTSEGIASERNSYR